MRRLSGWLLSIALHGGVLALACVTTVTIAVRPSPFRSESEPPAYAVTLRPDAPVIIPPQCEMETGGRMEIGEVPAELLTPERIEIPFDPFAIRDPVERPAKKYEATMDQRMRRPSERDARMGGGGPGRGLGGDSTGGTGTIGVGSGGPEGGGGNGTGGPADGPAVEIYNPAPEYPTGARRRGAEGNVLVEISISVEGAATDATVVEGSGADDLDAAAVAAVKTWKFRAAVRGGQSVASRERIRFVFKLKA